MAAVRSVNDQLRGSRHRPAGVAAGLVPGRSGAVGKWLSARDPAWQTGRLDPSTPFAAAVRWLLPQATIVVDHFYLIAR